MHDDHLQGILFNETTTLDLRQHGMARRIVTSIATKTTRKAKKRVTTRLTKRGGFSGPANLSTKSTTYNQSVSDLAGRMRTVADEDEA